MDKQPQVEAPKRVKRNRKFSKEIISEDSKALVLRVKHTPHKGEKIEDTIRTDRKHDPRQRFTDIKGRDL